MGFGILTILLRSIIWLSFSWCHEYGHHFPGFGKMILYFDIDFIGIACRNIIGYQCVYRL